ncbi:MAG: ATP-dependent DNA helicase RecQ [Lutibacter sp.]|nr:ATP-dependent DNA helicase RecQ [Lutibacter sp.]
MSGPLDILQKYWGYADFRPMQEAIIQSILSKNDTLVLLPTGGGKSLCYQVPAMLQKGVCIVVSPLIALMHDQVEQLANRHIKAIALTAQLSTEETIVAFDNLRYGHYKFLYLSPEKLQSPFIQEKINQLTVSLFAIDEAHCISEWGHDFRPSYLNLKVLKSLKPEAPLLALTATATQRVCQDILQHLLIENPTVFKASFYRDNLTYRVIHTEDIQGRLLKVLSALSGSVIIYTNYRKDTRTLSQFLNARGHKSGFYHGGLTSNEKQQAFKDWMQDKRPIMVATNAFGMGIDKSSVRAVIHIDTPASIEHFVQEAGRAGRDQKSAFSICLTNPYKRSNALDRFKRTEPTVAVVKNVYQQLNQYFNIALGTQPCDPFDFSLTAFCDIYNLNSRQTQKALSVMQREGILSVSQQSERKSILQFSMAGRQLDEYSDRNPSKSKLINLLLRTYGGIFERATTIDESFLCKKLRLSNKRLISHLEDLHKDGVLMYEPTSNQAKLRFLVAREEPYTINRIANNIERQYKVKLDKLTAVINYLTNTQLCSKHLLLQYFEEKPVAADSCGDCDVCRKKKSTTIDLPEMAHQILSLIGTNPLDSVSIATALDLPEKEVLHCLQVLLEKNKISLTSRNTFKTKQPAE